MNIRLSRNIEAGMWYTISNFLMKGAVFLSTPIILRIVSQSTFGEYTNFNAWLSVFSIVGTGYLFNSILCAQYDFEKEIDSYISSITILGVVIAVIVFAFVYGIGTKFPNLMSMTKKHLVIMFLYLMFDTAYQNYLMYHRIKLSYKQVVLVTVAITILPIFTSVLFAKTFNNKLNGLIMGKILPMIFICFVLFVSILKRKLSFKWEYCKYALKVAIPLIPHALASILLITSDRIIIQQLCGADKLAIYSVVYICGMVVSLVYNSISQAWAPWLLKKLNECDYSSIQANSKPYFLFFIAFATIAVTLVPEIVWLVGGNSFKEAINLIPLIMEGIVFQFFYSFYVNIEFFCKKTHRISVNTIVAALINIVLNYTLIPRFGFEVAAYTTLFGYICLFIMHYISVKQLKLHKIYDTKWHLKIIFLYSIYISFCIGFLFEYNELRYIIVTCLICMSAFRIKKYLKTRGEYGGY